ncbi:NAD(+) diphosphatase [Myceligenerans pegani]|uniref:NAD(+) diphosphatase n=1 Tax=Myceligenerans pegani TaxID=2776917 RepID=A0ABR9MTJ3_9MICO|nr:NAD(+) diphosphatase [Myceligenerans sp. TRM 65318]MBE1874696.1 NAD(+) diphosphatase [Myceligenerans sp. TRM 65318]MBE3016967.1 NAD(+) diphosphatase [Myceligenerans sp. TRM 65318]
MLDLPLAYVAHDRAAHRRSKPGLVDELLARPETGVVLVSSGRVATAGRTPALLSAEEAAVVGRDAEHYFLGESDDVAYLALVLPATADDDAPALPGDLTWRTPRDLADVDPALPAEAAGAATPPATTGGAETTGTAPVGPAPGVRLAIGLAVEAVGLANWHADHAHCPRCGEPTEIGEAGWARRCTADDLIHYPRTDPAVIMAVVDADDRLLLGRSTSWPPGRMSVLAGFVEPGESAEHAVAREAMEEAGIVVGRIEYRGSMPWPMPRSLMLGYRARAETTELRPDGDEVTDLRWFTRAELAAALADGNLQLSSRALIGRVLIEEWYGRPIGP